MLAALEPQLGVLEQHDRRRGVLAASPDLDAPVEQLEDHPPGALG